MAEIVDSNQKGNDGGISETISQGIEYLQSAVTGSGSGTGDDDASGKPTIGEQGNENKGAESATASGVQDGHVEEMLREKYKSKPESGDEAEGKPKDA